MITWLDPISELMQPFFFYSLVLPILFTSLTCIILKVFKVHNPRFRSLFYMIPLLLPLVVYAIFPPSYLMAAVSFGRFTVTTKMSNPVKFEEVSSSRDAFISSFPFEDTHLKLFVIHVFSVTGLLCLTGLIVGTALLVFLYVFGSRIVCWLQGVVELTPEEKPELAAMVKGLARRAGISMPRIGITEDLRPNAFTIGYGKNAMIVFSLGLLKILDKAELEAVISHEIAHIKNHDFHFNAVVSALKVISFFNPIVHLLSPTIKKEREVLADNTGMELIERPWILGLALTKIWEASKGFSESLLRRWVSSFFIVSEIRYIRNLLATHPTLESRLSNIAEKRSRKNASRNEMLRAILACTVITVMIICVCNPLIWTYDPLTQMRASTRGTNEISFTRNGVGRLVISTLPNIHYMQQFRCRIFSLEEATKDRSGLFMLLEKFNPKQLSSPLFYASTTSASSHLYFPFFPSQVSCFTYSWILTSVDIVAVATILILSCCGSFGKAVKKLLK